MPVKRGDRIVGAVGVSGGGGIRNKPWPMLRSLLYETLSIGNVNTKDNQRSDQRLDGRAIDARALGGLGKPIGRAGPFRHIHQLTQRVAAAGQA